MEVVQTNGQDDELSRNMPAHYASVLIVTRRYPPEMLGGVESRFQVIAETASNMGHRVRVLITERAASSEARNANLRLSGLGWDYNGIWHPLRLRRSLANALVEIEKPTVAWVANPQLVGSLKAVWSDVPVILMPGQVRSLDAMSCVRRLNSNYRRAGGRFASSWALHDIAFRRGIRHSDLVAVPCHHQKAVITSGLSWAANKTRVLPRGIKTEMWNACRRKRKGDDGAPLKLLVACRLHPLKNLPMAVQAVGHAARNGVLVELRIVGSGSEESAIRELTASLKLDERVQYFPSTHDVQQHYHWADAFIMCSHNELFGNTVLEAIASGCPVLLRENSPPDVVIGCWDCVRDCPAVIPFPAHGELGLAEAIQRMKCTPGYLAQLADEATRWSDRLDWQHCLSEYLDPQSTSGHECELINQAEEELIIDG